jgi:hypothetical protein
MYCGILKSNDHGFIVFQTLTNVQQIYMYAKIAQIVTTLLGITLVSVLWAKPEMEQKKEGANYLMEMHIQ